MSNFIINILESFLGEPYSHNESTGQVRFDCINCAEINGYINETDGKHNLEINYYKDKFNCWSCGKEYNMHGSISKLIKRYGTKNNLKDYELYKPSSDEIDDYITNERINNAVELPPEYKPLTQSNGLDQKYIWAKNYLKSRGITNDFIKRYNIGYASDGYYKNRIIIPSYDSNGHLNYFITRSFLKNAKQKYLNPKVEKQEMIFNEHLINYDTTIFLVEGVFDHIVIPNSIPLLGKVLYHMLAYKLLENANADIVIVLDGDAKDYVKTIKNQLDKDRLKGRIKICVINDNDMDPSKMYELNGSKGVIELLRNGIENID